MRIDENTRYLASYLRDNEHLFVDIDSGNVYYLDLEKLQEVIQEFYDSKP
jgi:hypothetical protein